MGKVINFDKFISEKKKETIEVTVYGDVYTIPDAIPAIVPVMMARAEESDDKAETTRMVMKAADAIFGKENVNKLCEKGMAADELASLITKVFAAVNGTDDDEDDEMEELDDESSRAPAKSKPGKK